MASPSGAGQLRRPGYQADETPQEQQEVDRPGSVAPPEQRGGYDCEFMERPRELQTDCPICLLVLREPFQVACCGNSFCRTCIERIQTNRKVCPTCNKANFAVFSDKRLRRSLYAFRVRCMHQESGCEWTGELEELERHLNLNPKLGKQLVGCVFTAVACTHCREYFQRHHVHAHESESCPQRPFSCDYCEDYGSVYEDVVNNHWPVCKCYPVPCPNECGVSPERQNVETHVNTVCPLTVVNCDFHYAGCEVQLVRKNMPTHLAESLATHISLLTTQTHTLAGRGGQDNLLLHLSLLSLHNQQLTHLTIQQKESLEELRKENDALKQKVNESAQEVVNLRKQQKEDRASLVTLQQQIGVLPPIEITMSNFDEMKKSNDCWYSPPFYTHPQGYKMCLSVNANGWGNGEGTHVSVFAYLMRGEFDDSLKWPFQGSIVLQLCNQLEDKRHRGDTINFSKTTDPKFISRVTSGEVAEEGWGAQTLITHNDIKFKRASKCQYLKDNCLQFRIITVESLSEPGVLPSELTMTNFEQRQIETNKWFSPPFYTHPRGYKMCLSVVANGWGIGKGTHVSVGACLMRGEFDDHLKWPFRGRVVFQLCNQLEDKRHCGYTIDFSEIIDPKFISRVTSGQVAEEGWGTQTLITHKDLNFKQASKCQYLKNDCLQFRIITVESLSEPGVLPTELTVTNFEEHKTKSDQWFSPPFHTHPQGYKMQLSVVANGIGDSKGTHVSVYARLMRGEFDDHLKWPFRGHVTVEILNQLEDDNHATTTIRFTDTTDNEVVGRVTDEERSPSGWGYSTFLAHTDLDYNSAKNCQYLKYDCLRFQIVSVELK